MPITAQIDQGSLPSYVAVDETGISIRGVDWNPKRDYLERKDADGQIVWHSARGPRLEGTIKGAAVPSGGGALQGLATVHPGVAVAIANFAEDKAVHGFVAPASAKVISKDPTQTTSEETETELTIPFVFLPAISSFSSATS